MGVREPYRCGILCRVYHEGRLNFDTIHDCLNCQNRRHSKSMDGIFWERIGRWVGVSAAALVQR